MRTQVRLQSVGALIEGVCERPHDVLGVHPLTRPSRGERYDASNDDAAVAVRAWLPGAGQAWVESPGEVRRPMRRIHPAGLFEALCPAMIRTAADYQLRVSGDSGKTRQVRDPYAFAPMLSEYDLYLFGEGQHWRIYDKLGAQLRVVDGVPGINFAVWAPNAAGVSVVGDFNGWNAVAHPLQKRIPSGVWEIFIPELKAGEKYKFAVRTAWGETVEKSDPYGFAAELPPRTASIVWDHTQYQWNDGDWIDNRAERQSLDKPISVYEVHLGSWKKDWERENGWMDYRELARQLVDYCKRMGYTHLELMPVSEHPFTGSWGYQTVGYFAATSRYGTPDDFKFFVDHCHQNGIGVIVDWVPAHFPKDGHGLRRFDGTGLYEHEDPRKGEHPDWGTMIFNYGRNEVRNFLVSNALFWLEKYHIDGLRVDAVASMLYLDYSRKHDEWIPNDQGGRENMDAIHFLRQFNEKTHEQFPGTLTIAEESTSWDGVTRMTSHGGLGFSIKWNMGWMNDTLRYFSQDPIHRRYHHNGLTFSLIYAFSENFMLPLSHDEVVHGKKSLLDQMPGDLWQKFANLRLLYSYMWAHPGKKLHFMGNEIGMWREWSEANEIEWNLLEWPTHRGIQNLCADLNKVYRDEPALHEIDFRGQGFEWIDCMNWEESSLAWIRRAKDPEDYVIVCANFTPVPRLNHRIGLPAAGRYREIFNSDSHHYDGSNVGNAGVRDSQPLSWHGRENSLEFALPPLGLVMFKPER
ncbi:MAG TPA: 1,4-alpha-glucan branching protein GlgB [Pirellulaceae bacterium]|nr:1,4-alpha-glucan branching protein GlgB [Pirellulaceae bacterium]